MLQLEGGKHCCLPSDSEGIDYSFSLDSLTTEDDETVEINGFEVLVWQESQVKEMFEKHPDLTSDFNLKNQQLKNAYLNVLLDLIDTLCQSAEDLSMEDLKKGDSTLMDLTRAGLKVGWLRSKLDEAYLRKEKERASGAMIIELEEQVNKRKLTLSDLESDLEKEKSAALAAKTDQLDFSDVV